MEETLEDDTEFSEEIFTKTFKILKQKSGNKYDFIIKGGHSLHRALYKLYETVWNKEEKPDS